MVHFGEAIGANWSQVSDRHATLFLNEIERKKDEQTKKIKWSDGIFESTWHAQDGRMRYIIQQNITM